MERATGLSLYLYLRKSRKDIEEEKKSGEAFDTLDRHRRALFAVAAKERHHIESVFEEVVSGESISERPRIQEMLRGVESGLVDGVLVMDLDRLGRGDMLDQGLLDRAFRYSGTQLLTPTETYDPTSETWELVFGIKSLVAREELKAITRRMQRGRRASAGEGKSVSKKPPYGYRRDENLRLHPDEDTAWVVRKMFEMLRDGHGRQAIAQELDKLGIAPPDEKRESWSPSSITTIIKNEVYIGNIIWGQIQYKKRNGKYVRNRLPRDQWTIKEGAHDPIVSRELFDAANQAHTGRFRPSTVATKKLSNPLAGVLKCEVCGYTMLYTPRKDRPNSTLRCPNPRCKGVQKGALLPLVEQAIHRSMLTMIRQYETMLEQKDAGDPQEMVHLEKEVSAKNEELAELNKQKDSLHDLLEKGIYDAETFLERQRGLKERIDKARQELSETTALLTGIKAEATAENVQIPALQKVADIYFEADIETRNLLLKSLFEKITFLRPLDWKKPHEFSVHLYPRL